MDLMAPLKTGKRGQRACEAIRAVSPKMEKDRVMYEDFTRIADVIASGKISIALE
jgi:histidine ammonia-lyase